MCIDDVHIHTNWNVDSFNLNKVLEKNIMCSKPATKHGYFFKNSIRYSVNKWILYDIDIYYDSKNFFHIKKVL